MLGAGQSSRTVDLHPQGRRIQGVGGELAVPPAGVGRGLVEGKVRRPARGDQRGRGALCAPTGSSGWWMVGPNVLHGVGVGVLGFASLSPTYG